MSKPRNGNRKCSQCRHYFAAHSMREGDAGKCVVPGCPCKGGPWIKTRGQSAKSVRGGK